MFEIQPMSPELYRQQTRRSTFVVIAIFLVLAMLCATASTQLFGGPPGDNFKWNLLGVLSGLALTVAVVRQQLWHRPFMAAAAWLVNNTVQNLAALGKDFSFGFLGARAGYDISQRLIPYTNDNTHARAALHRMDRVVKLDGGRIVSTPASSAI